MQKNKQYLLWYLEIEKELSSFFHNFENLCQYCFSESISTIESKKNRQLKQLCCCLVDNQVHDYWPYLNCNQKTANGPNWSAKLAKDKALVKNPTGRGPCPALTDQGCSIRLRPPTCSTQLCTKMLRILKELNVGVIKSTDEPCQIEDLIGTNSPLDILYGIRKGKISREIIDDFLKRIRDLSDQMKAIPRQDVEKVIAREKQRTEKELKKGGK